MLVKEEKIEQDVEKKMWENEKEPEGKGKGTLMAKQNQPLRKFYVGRKAPGFGCFFRLQFFLWARQKKRDDVPILCLDFFHFWTQFIVIMLPADASLVWSFGVQRLGSPDSCIRLFLLYNLRSCLYN